jgi:hypothetical protein
MAFDIAISATLAVVTIGLGYLGVHVTLHPAKSPQHKKWYKVGFLCFGLVAVALVIWQGIRNGNKQIEATADLNRATEETTKAREEARLAKEELKELINSRSRDTASQITRFQSDTEGAFSKISRPPRTITVQQKQNLLTRLKNIGPHEIAIRHTLGHEESHEYANAISSIMQEAGWKIRKPATLYQTGEIYGIWVMIKDEKSRPEGVDDLIKILNEVRIETKAMMVSGLGQKDIDLMIGLQGATRMFNEKGEDVTN